MLEVELIHFSDILGVIMTIVLILQLIAISVTIFLELVNLTISSNFWHTLVKHHNYI